MFRKLKPDERPKYQYEYSVIGTGFFPLDMLRHDAAWPASAAYAGVIERQNDFQTRPQLPVAIMLRSYRLPTVERWKSFGWQVQATE